MNLAIINAGGPSASVGIAARVTPPRRPLQHNCSVFSRMVGLDDVAAFDNWRNMDRAMPDLDACTSKWREGAPSTGWNRMEQAGRLTRAMRAVFEGD